MNPAAHFGSGRIERRRSRGWGFVLVVALHVGALYALLALGVPRSAEIAARTLVFLAVLPAAAPTTPSPPAAQPTSAPTTPVVARRKPVAVPDPIAPSTPPAPPDAEPVAHDAQLPVAASAPAAPVMVATTTAMAVAPATAPVKVITAVEYLRPPRVEYPSESRRMREHGRVVVRVLIDPWGNAKHAELHVASAHPRLNAAAIKAVSEALFRPYAEDGETRAVWALVPVTFQLRD